MRRFAVVRYVLLEITFTLAMLIYFFKLHNMYSVSGSFEAEILKIVCLSIIMLIWLIGPMLNRLVMFLLGFVYTFYFVSQNVYKRAFQQYYHFSTAKDYLAEVWGERASALEFVSLRDFIPFAILLAICLVFFLLYLLFQRDCIILKWRILYKTAVLLLLFPIRTCADHYNLLVDKLKSQADNFQLYHSEYYSFDMMQNVNDFVDKYGILTFALRDGQKFLSKEVLGEEAREEIRVFLQEQPSYNKTEYNGLFAGKNAFFIQAESFINAAVDEDLTPTLYKMFNEGIVFDNFNTPLLAGSTSDTEFMANTSIIPVTLGKSVCYNFFANTYPTTLPNIFNKYGFNSVAYHNNYGEYYNRSQLMPNFGYKAFYDCTGLGREDGSPDSDILDEIKWIYAGTNNPYMAYWITYSGHQPYTKYSVGVTDDEWEAIYAKYPNIGEDYASLLAKNMDLDRGLAEFMSLMEDNGKLDDVVFILFGDHIAKGIDYSEQSEYYVQTGNTYKEDSAFTSLVFYNTATKGFHYYKEGTIVDLLPTVCDLWNFDYDEKTVFGRNLLDDNYDGFYFSDYGNWLANDYEYNPLTGEIIIKNGSYYDIDKATQEMSRRVKEREICNQILELDYFRNKNDNN